MNKNIWYISKYAISATDGNPTRQYFLSKYLAKEGFDVTLISSRSSGIKGSKVKGIGRKTRIEGFNHVLINGPEIKLGINLKRILSWVYFETLLFISPIFIKYKKPDIIIVSSLSLLTIITGFLFKKIYNSKLIFEVRDIWPLTLMELKNISSKNIFIFILRSIEKFGYKRSNFIVGTMPKLDEHIKNSIKNKFNFKYIPMGYDPEFYTNLNIVSSDFDNLLPKNKFIVGYAGTIGVANRVEIIVEVAEKLNNKNNNILFAILGDGPLKSKLEERTKKLNNIVFFPKVKKEFVNNFLSKCDILVNPWQDKNLYKFGVSPNKWIDYMYSAKPIIVSYNGYKSIINEAKCGEFIPANNVKLLTEKIVEYSKKDKTELKKIGENGKKYLEKNLSYFVLSKKYIDIFNSLYV